MRLFLWYLGCFFNLYFLLFLFLLFVPFDHANSKSRMPADNHKETRLSRVCMYLKFQAGAAFTIALVIAKF